MNDELNNGNNMDNKDTDKSSTRELAQKPTVSFEALAKPPTSGVRKPSSTNSSYPDFSKVPSTDKLMKAIVVFIAILLIGFGAGWLGSYTQKNNSNISTAKEIVTSQNQVTAAIAQDVSPSVVSIDAVGSTQTQGIFGATTTPSES